MTLADVLKVSHGPYYIKAGRFNEEKNKHEFKGEIYESSDDIPYNLMTRTVTLIGIEPSIYKGKYDLDLNGRDCLKIEL